MPQELFDWIAKGGLVEAHNAFFERMIWKNVMVARHGWPEVPHKQWRCSAAKASTFSLPRALGAAGAAMGLSVQKDDVGRKLMLKMCKPRKPRKAEVLAHNAEIDRLRGELAIAGENYRPVLQEQLDALINKIWYHEEEADFWRLGEYCETDVDSEHNLSLSLRDLPPFELRLWQMDQAMNERGVYCDVDMAATALRIAERECAKLNDELNDFTDGEVPKGSSRAKLVDWVNRQDVPLPNTQAGTLDEFMAMTDEKVPPLVKRALYICKHVNKTSTAKYAHMLQAAASDSTLKDMMMYHGANTGRWAGKGVQPHNFPRGNIKDMEVACEVIKTGDMDLIHALYGEDVMELLSGALRGALTAPPGKDLLVADYSSIEARVVFWLAGCERALEIFHKGMCIYMDMATDIYGYPVTDKKKQFMERQMGKQAILGLGFQMGFLTFLFTCHKYDIKFTVEQVKDIVKSDWSEMRKKVLEYFKGDKRRAKRLEEEDLLLDDIMHELILMQFIVDRYRSRYSEVADFWRDLNNAAIEATENRGRVTKVGLIEFKRTGRFLHMKLPSGRLLSYNQPRVAKKKTPWGSDGKVLKFMGVDPYTKKWCLQETYGGMLCENAVQATARDLMADAMLRAEDTGIYEVNMSVHDELVTIVDEDKGDVKEFEDLMSESPRWAEGCPVAAEGWRGKRYRK